jgi:murein DD-endopeptidase MepM/ murein hydrolase activator NlpD
LNHLKASRFIPGVIFILILLMPGSAGFAQETEPTGPVYVVQEGDSLWDIALRFRVSMEELASLNRITDPSQLSAGAQLVIPGLEGIQGTLTTRSVAYGDTLHGLSRRFQIPVDILTRLNHLTNPSELYAGTSLVILEQPGNTGATNRATPLPGQSLLELSVMNGENPWSYVLYNDLGTIWNALPGDVLHLPESDPSQPTADQPGALPESITQVALQPLPFVQGKTAQVRVLGEPGLTLSGSLGDHQFHFFPDGDSGYIGFQGIHAMTEPGLYDLTISGTLPISAPYQSAPFSFSQAVLINSGGYPFDPVLIVSPETIDPAVTRPEDAQWTALATPATPEKLWNGIFKSPAPEIYSKCWPSLFGSRRSYNGSAYSYFHSGLDFCGGVGTEILAPADGKVVFAGPLTVRGNAIMIDHGWGIYTGYMHLSEIRVAEGDEVKPGQVIGLVGGTGRVTGPHLHWEVWAGGVQVDPLDWLEQVFPD